MITSMRCSISKNFFQNALSQTIVTSVAVKQWVVWHSPKFLGQNCPRTRHAKCDWKISSGLVIWSQVLLLKSRQMRTIFIFYTFRNFCLLTMRDVKFEPQQLWHRFCMFWHIKIRLPLITDIFTLHLCNATALVKGHVVKRNMADVWVKSQDCFKTTKDQMQKISDLYFHF